MPTEEQAFAFWLSRSVNPGDEAALSALLGSNRELLAKTTAAGGKRYAPYSIVISPAEWHATTVLRYGPVSLPRRQNTTRIACYHRIQQALVPASCHAPHSAAGSAPESRTQRLYAGQR